MTDSYPKMIAKLKETFPPSDEGSSCPPFGTSRYAAMMLTGMPIEQVAESLNKRYLAETSRQIKSTGAYLTPSVWAIICPPHVFENWTEVDQVPIYHTSPQDWTLFLVRTSFDFSDLPLPLPPTTEENSDV